MSESPTTAPRRSPALRWGWFAAWLVLGATYALALVGVLTIGVFVAPIAVVGTVVVARRRDSLQGLPGLLSGVALPLFYVAYLNRDGPGSICSASRGGQSCVDEWSPWPWFGIAVALALLGLAVFRIRGRSSTSAHVERSTRG
jgi:amino acid transporter